MIDVWIEECSHMNLICHKRSTLPGVEKSKEYIYVVIILV